MDERISFEEALRRLEEIVEMLESDELPLEKALEVFEEGVRMSRICSEIRQRAELKVEELIRQSDGTIEFVPFRTIQEEE